MRTLPRLMQTSTPTSRIKVWQRSLVIDRDTASRLGVSAADIDNVALRRFRTAAGLDHVRADQPVPRGDGSGAAVSAKSGHAENIYVRSSTGAMVPLSAFTHFGPSNTSLAVNHQGQWPSVTISFNLAPGVSLGQATTQLRTRSGRSVFPRPFMPVFRERRRRFRIRCRMSRS